MEQKYDRSDRTAKEKVKKVGCRTCDDFKSWSKKQGDIYRAKDEANTEAARRDDCPLDKGELGRATWGLLHTIGAAYPENPTDDDKKTVKSFIDSLSKIYPCDYCARDLRDDMIHNPINVQSKRALSKWLCDLHNRVNQKLNKPLFDCTQVFERWRDGWLDGSCD